MKIFQPTITGSLNISGSLTVTGTITGTASYATTASYAINGGNTILSSNTSNSASLYSLYPPAYITSVNNQILFGYNAGSGSSGAYDLISLGTSASYNATTAFRSVFLGRNAGFNAASANDSIFIGYQAGESATNASNANFIGQLAGYNAPYAFSANFLGYQAGYGATNAASSNFFGNSAGISATDAYGSNFIGFRAGNSSKYADDSNFIGSYAGGFQNSASYSTFLGYQAGDATNNNVFLGKNNIIIGTNITLPAGTKDSINLGGIIFATGSYSDSSSISPTALPQYGIGRVGINKVSPNYTLDVSGSGNYSNGLTVTGSINVVGNGITGSLLGTASYAVTASYALNGGSGGSGNGFPYNGTVTPALVTGSLIVSGSGITVTGSITSTGGFTGSLQGTSSWATKAITASYADNFTVANTLTAQTIVVQTITASIEWITGSSKFGSLLTNTHQFTGSVGITGSLNVVGNGITGSLLGTSSYAITASYALNASVGPSTPSSLIFSGSVTASVDVGNTTFQLISGSTTMLFVSKSGNVGIGTASPSFSLDVNGTGNFSDALLIQKSTFPYIRIQNTSTTSGYPFISLKNSAFSSIADGNPIGQITVVDNNNSVKGDISFYKSGSYTNVILNSVGYVGIGTSSPLYRLDVNGTIRLASGGTMLITGLTNVTQSDIVSINTSTGQLYYQNTIPTSSYAITASYALVSSGTVTNAVSASYALTASYAMNGGGGAAFPYTGSAGISGSLSVKGNVNILTGYGGNGYFRLSDTEPGSSVPTTIQTSFGNTFILNNLTYSSSNGFTYNENGSAGSFIQMEPSAGQMLFYTAPVGTTGAIANYTQSLRITDGKVGIRMSTTPAYELDVSGSINFTGNLYQNGSPFGGGSGFPYTGSAGINGDLSVHNTTDTTVASFEGVNGFPLQIVTTSGPLTYGYSASLGSIGNGDGILYLKTGSTNEDWAPISYDNHLVQSTQYGIDLSTGDYTIPGPGIYELSNAATNDLIFPDPASFTGQRIVVINTDQAANIDNTNTWAPYIAGTTNQLGAIGIEDMWEFISINSKWRGIKSGK